MKEAEWWRVGLGTIVGLAVGLLAARRDAQTYIEHRADSRYAEADRIRLIQRLKFIGVGVLGAVLGGASNLIK